ncbi:MAG: ROK family protein [Oscillospiraceae bacterium]|nr:ROK family protein [Oscillospiraceae bacterium]
MYYIGIDIGGTNLKAGLVDESYQITAARKMPLKFESMEQMGETLAEMAIALAEENNIPRDQVASVGMGFPGPVDNKRGVVVKTVNIPIRSMPVAEMFHKYWDLPVYLGNDADCAALGEFYHYEDKNIESLILVTLGTGIGTGIILGGKIHTGINGCAGEGGHIVIVHNGDQCTCGRKGCWERYASANALIRQTIAAMDEHPDSAMWGLAGGALNRVDGRTAFEAMRKGDATARAVVDQYLEYLGEGLSNFVNIFQPEVIALGGGVSHERDEDLLVPLQSMVLEQCFGREAEKHPKLVKARLGNDAGIIGAALLGLAQ